MARDSSYGRLANEEESCKTRQIKAINNEIGGNIVRKITIYFEGLNDNEIQLTKWLRAFVCKGLIGL